MIIPRQIAPSTIILRCKPCVVDSKTFYEEKHDKGTFVKNIITDNIMPGDIYIRAKELKKDGFKYLGSVTVYSHLQACGIINDHGKDCPCYRKIIEQYPTVRKR